MRRQPNVRIARTLCACIAVSLASLLSTSAAQDLVPSADAVARGGRYANGVSGQGMSLVVKNSQFGEFNRWSYLKFDLSGIDLDISRAVLALSVRSIDGDTTVAIETTGDRWTERTLRWNARPKPGAMLAMQHVAADGQREVLIDVTDYVRAEAKSDGTASFVLTTPEANGRYLSFFSRESGQSPLLLIDRSGTALTPRGSTNGRSAIGTSADSRSQPVVAAAAPPTEPTSWTFCANDEQRCMLPGNPNEARMVRYGANGQYVRRTFFKASIGDHVGCDIRLFKIDPAPGVAKRCEYSSVLVSELPAPTNPMGPSVDRTRIPVGEPGTAQVLTRSTAEQTSPSDGTGAFRLVCMYSHMNFDDPIVYPGQSGRSHLHAYFGNTLADANSTVASLSNNGNSTCGGGLINRSAYWVPSIIDTRTGRPVTPRSNIVYYKTGYSLPASSIQYLPKGLRMIAGSMLASADQDFSGWSCGDHTLSGGSIPANCPAGQDLIMNLIFPQCWDGVNLDSPDHKSHMAYPRNGVCPSTHPVGLPEITYNVHYNVSESNASNHWRLSSDMYGTDRPGGFSIHGDWYNAWDETAMRTWVDNCDVVARDCHAHLLRSGLEIYFDPTVHQVEPIILRGAAPRVRPRN
jgi:hypothetical protein